MAVLLLAAMIPIVLLSLTALLLPAAADLVRQPTHVPIWWAVPLLMLIPLFGGAIALPVVTEGPGSSRVEMTALLLISTQMFASALLLWMAFGLSLARGLRPGGETRRKRRTTVVALLLLLAQILGFVLVPLLVDEVWTMAWIQLPSAVAFFWVIAVNREGPERLMRGRSVSAGFLAAAGLTAAGAVLHGMVFFLSGEGTWPPLGAWAWLISSAVAVVYLIGALRVLTPIAWLPVVCSLAVWMVGVIPHGMWFFFDPLPNGIEVPEARTFSGERVRLDRVSRIQCLRVPELSYTEGPDCLTNPFGTGPFDYGHVAYSADTPLTEVLTLPTESLVVDHGRYEINKWRRWGDPLILMERNGEAYVLDFERSIPLGPELEAFLTTHDNAPIAVVRTPNWTLQDFATICASAGPHPSCSLLHTPSDDLY